MVDMSDRHVSFATFLMHALTYINSGNGRSRGFIRVTYYRSPVIAGNTLRHKQNSSLLALLAFGLMRSSLQQDNPN